MKEYLDTKGIEVIGTFNPSDNADVVALKKAAIELVNLIDATKGCPRRKAIAITQIELGTMAAVKSLFH